MIDLKKEEEKVILVGVSLPGQEDTGQLLDELPFLLIRPVHGKWEG